jgi:hypothetical protein
MVGHVRKSDEGKTRNGVNKKEKIILIRAVIWFMVAALLLLARCEMKQPRGYPVSHGKVRISVALSLVTFDRVARYAKDHHMMFSEAVELFCSTSLDRADALEASKLRIKENV